MPTPVHELSGAGAARRAPEAAPGALSFRPYRPSDKTVLLDMLGRVWDEDHRRAHAIMWDWQHGQDSLSPDPCHTGQVMELSGRIIGYSGAMPVQMAGSAGTFWGCVLVDTFVDPSFRGFGRHLMQHHIQTTSLALGAPIARVHPLWRRLCRRESIIVRTVRKRIRVMDLRPFLRRRGVPAQPAGLAQAGWSGVGQILHGVRARRSSPLRLERVERFPDSMDAFAAEFARGFRFSVLRSASFLNWRFVECPVGYEKWLLWSGDRVVGYVVYRVGTMNGRPVLLLIEALAIQEPARYYGVLLAHVEGAARQAGVCDIQTLETGCPVLARQLGRWGYLAKTDEVAIVGVSNTYGDKIYEGGWFLSAGGADFEFTFFNQGIEDLLHAGARIPSSQASDAEIPPGASDRDRGRELQPEIEAERHVQFRAYRSEDKDAVFDLIEAVWDERQRRSHEFLWDWQHARDACAPGPNGIAQVLEVDDRLVGYSGAIPAEFSHHGQVFWGAGLLDTALDVAHRGLGRKVMAHNIANATLIVGAPILRAQALWKRVLGRKEVVVHHIEKRVWIADVYPFLQRRGCPRPLAAVLQWGWRLRQQLDRAWRSPAPGAQLVQTDRFPDAVDSLAREFAADFDFSVLRSAAFLNWRFAEAPVAYRKYLLWDLGRLVGYVVYRIGTMNGRRVLFLIEAVAVGDRPRYYGIFLGHLTATALAERASEIQTIESGCPVLRDQLTAWGFRRKPEEISVVGTSRVPGLEEIYRARWWLTAGDVDFEFIFFNQGLDELQGRHACACASSRPT